MGPFAEFLITLSTQAPAAPTATPITDLLVVGLGAGGLGAIAAAVITGLFSKRKLGAEATEIITKAASGVVENIQKELDRTIEAREKDAQEHKREVQRLAAAHVKERNEWLRVLQLHVAWDAIAIAKMAEVGIELPPAPPMIPAQRWVDEHGHPVGD